MIREKSLTDICTLLLDSTIGNTKDKIYDYKGYYQQIKEKFQTVFRVFEARPQPVHTGGGPYGGRAFDALPGGV